MSETIQAHPSMAMMEIVNEGHHESPVPILVSCYQRVPIVLSRQVITNIQTCAQGTKLLQMLHDLLLRQRPLIDARRLRGDAFVVGLRLHPGALWISASHREKRNLGTGWALLMTMVVTVYAHLLGSLKRESVFIQTYLYVS